MNAPIDPQFAARIRDSFARQQAMALIGASIGLVAPGVVEIVLPFRDELTQQKGYVHGGIIGMIADSAAGYAAYTLMPADSTLVTSEYKINLLAAATSGLVARGEVVKAGRTLTVARAEVYADDRTHIATMQQTLMMLPGRTDQRE
jgi:uncharacterized protein (TIGR00369 family)